MTTARKPAPAGPDAVKALFDVITGDNGTVEIAHPVTLPGRPVTVHLSGEEVAAYLKATGWQRLITEDEDRWRIFRHGHQSVLIPLRDGLPVHTMPAAIERIAEVEGRHPLDVAEAIIARRDGGKAKGRKGSK